MLPISKRRDGLLNDTYTFYGIHMLNPNDKHSEQLIKTGTNKALQVTHMPPDPVKTYLSGFSQVAGRDDIHTALAERCE